ncbi:MAG: hypothetical protein FWG31_08500 [Oscillospiraceae bacterium]|nr:hypothetical protein [Oscillospiraceae bacterium]
MNKREELRQALDNVRMPEELKAKTLAAMKEQPPRKASFEGFGRLAAIAAAVVMLAVGGTLIWTYLFGGGQGDSPVLTSPPDGSPPPTPYVSGIRPEITIMPRVLACRQIIGTGQELMADKWRIITNVEDLISIYQEYGFEDVQIDPDFSTQTVVFLCDSDSPDQVPLPPVVSFEGATLDVYKRTEPKMAATSYVVPHGTFLIIEGVIERVNYHTEHEFRYDGVTIEQPDSGVIIHLPEAGPTVELYEGFSVYTGSERESATVIVSSEFMSGVIVKSEGARIAWDTVDMYQRWEISYRDPDTLLYGVYAYAMMDDNGRWSVEWVNEQQQPEPTPPVVEKVVY